MRKQIRYMRREFKKSGLTLIFKKLIEGYVVLEYTTKDNKVNNFEYFKLDNYGSAISFFMIRELRLK